MNTKKTNIDHLRHRSDGTFLCEHCGDTYKMNMPASINMVLDIMKSWKKSHRHCKKKPEPKFTAGPGVHEFPKGTEVKCVGGTDPNGWNEKDGWQKV